MTARLLLVVSVLAACAEDPDIPADPCVSRAPLITEGSAEVGIGDQFAPLADRQELEVVLGLQGLWMFVLNMRVTDMDVGTNDRRGVIDLAAYGEGGEIISLEIGCRARDFVDTGDGSRQLASTFMLALSPTIAPTLDGALVKLHLEVRDHEGRQAIDERTIVARVPTSMANGAPP